MPCVNSGYLGQLSFSLQLLEVEVVLVHVGRVGDLLHVVAQQLVELLVFHALLDLLELLASHLRLARGSRFSSHRR